MGKYHAYPDYKDSRLPWLGRVPAHWAVCKVKHGAKFQVGWTPPTGRDENFVGDNLWANISDIQKKVISDTAKRISDDAAAAASMSITPAGSLLYSFKLSVGAVGFAGRDMYTNEAIASFLKDEKVSLAYLYYALPKFLIENASENIYGAKILNQELIKNAPLVLPTPQEQESIAIFLDHETAKIDWLIAKQERLIELLKEKRQAVISHAVTKGLNPDAPMKDSGAGWLGEVPAHWGIARVKYVAKLESGHTPSKQIEEYWLDCDIPWVSLNDSKQLAQVDYISDTAYQINHKGIAGSSARLLPAGAVVFTRDATIGLTAITTREMAVSQHLIAWLPRKQISSLFLLRVFNAMKDELDRFTFGATIKTIGMDDVKSLTTTVPPIEEQEAICIYIEEQLAKFDLLIQKAERQIGLLKEHRVSLISSAVTGKIDVRGWQKPNTEPQEAATAASA